jgi:hypothetical protein
METDMRKGRFAATGASLLALLVCATGARADVLDQVPSDALLVLKVKNLDGVSKKVAKWAKDLGIDQQDPAWADPLGALSEKAHLGKGVNRGGDLAVAMLDPAQAGGDNEKAVVVLVPTSDYKAFLSNFKSATDAGGGISKATPQEGNQDVYVANWGQYAAVTPGKGLLAKKPAGIKLSGFSGKESEAKDALLYVNMKVLKGKLLPELKSGRENLLGMVGGALGDGNGKKYVPLAKAAVGQVLNVAEEFLNDAHSSTLGLSITDAGIGLTAAADFDPTSYIGKLALATKGTSASLLNGLPARKYFVYGGAVADPTVTKKLVADLIDPIVKELAAIPDMKKFAGVLESVKGTYGSMNGYSLGLVAPTGALGQESVIQQVAIIRGDSKVIQKGQREMLSAMNDLMALMPQQQGLKSSFELKPDAKTVGGVQFDEFKTNMTFPEDDPQAQQAKQMMAMIYGPTGMTGLMGRLDDKTLVSAQGGSDELVTDLVTAAKANADTLGATGGVRAVAAALPKERTSVFYIDVGTIASTTMRYMKGFGAAPANVKIPADLPPIGFAGGSDGTAIRVDIHVPTKLVQGMVSTYMEAQRQMRNPNGGLQ